MQVTHVNDHVTHAVIGGGEQINFGISDDAAFFNILSSTLYSDQMLAMVRETLCNAWDAHIDAGCTDKPIEVTVNSESFIIKDFGKGIPHDKIGPIYAVYGNSTKKNDGQATGGFGLGCKSPFAYTDHFEVTSCCNGEKTIYRMSKSSAEVEGKPSITTIIKVPTTETGLTVKIDLITPEDRHRMCQLAERIMQNGAMNAMFNGNKIIPLPFEEMKHGFMLTGRDVLETRHKICIRYGNVIYPLEENPAYSTEWHQMAGLLNKQYINGYRTDMTLVLQAPAHSISVTPSREALSIQPKTIATVKKLMADFMTYHKSKFNVVATDLVVEAVQDTALSPTKERHDLLEPSKVFNGTMKWGKYAHARVCIMDIRGLASRALYHHLSDFSSITKAQEEERFRMLAESKEYNRLLFKRLNSLRVANQKQWVGSKSQACGAKWTISDRLEMDDKKKRNVRQWFARNVAASLIRGMPESMKLRQFFVMHREKLYGSKNWGDNIVATELHRYYSTQLEEYLPFIRNIVVLSHNRTEITYNMLNSDPEFKEKYGNAPECIAYIVPRSPKRLEEARNFFKSKKGIVFVDLTPEQVAAPPVKRDPAAPKKVRVEGLPQLIHCWQYGQFTQSLAIKKETPRVVTPVAWTKLIPDSHKTLSRSKLPDLDAACTAYAREALGTQIGVVLNSKQSEKLETAGIPNISDYIISSFTEALKFNGQGQSNDPVLYEMLQWERDRVATHETNVDEMLALIYQNDFLRNKFNVSAPLDNHRRLHILAVRGLIKKKRENRWSTMPQNLLDAEVAINAIPVHPNLLKLRSMLCAGPLLPSLNISALEEVFKQVPPAPKERAYQFIRMALKP